MGKLAYKIDLKKAVPFSNQKKGQLF